MATSAVQQMDTNAILDKVVPVTQMVMDEAMMVGGMHLTSSMRESGAAAKFITNSKNTYKGNPIVEGVINSLSHRKGEHKEKIDVKNLAPGEVMRRVDEIDPILESAGEHGMQTKNFIYGLAETVVNASGSGFMGTGERVNANEAKFLGDLKAHLRI